MGSFTSMISDKYRYIFLHVTKTGGSSIEQALISNEEDVPVQTLVKDNWIDNLQQHVKDKFRMNHHDHRHMQWHYNYDQYLKYYPRETNSYYKFTIVRNPWDRAVSEWKYFNKVYPGYNLDFKSSLITTQFAGKMYPWEEHNWSQHVYTTNCDYVGRFENLQNDFDNICKDIGLPQQKLPWMNKTTHKHYTEYYDEEAKSIVAERNARDIEYFGYKFG